MTPRAEVFQRVEKFIGSHITTTPGNVFVATLWAIGTHVYEHVSVFPYAVITASTKRAGKSLFSRLIGYVSKNPKPMGGVVASVLIRMLADKENPVSIFIDEAEGLNSETTNLLRTVMNVGFMKTGTITRTTGGLEGELVEMNVYGPKLQILIGDVYDTLKDRSLVFEMRRETIDNPNRQRERIGFTDAQGKKLADEITATLDDGARQEIADKYLSFDFTALNFLQSDRDIDLWAPIFTIAQVFVPERMDELKRVAADMSVEKTAPTRKYDREAQLKAEQEMQDEEYAVRLLKDLRTIIGSANHIFSKDAIDKLKDLPTGPWRKYRGMTGGLTGVMRVTDESGQQKRVVVEGLTDVGMAHLLDQFGLKSRQINVRKEGKNARGYTRPDIDAACKRAGITE